MMLSDELIQQLSLCVDAGKCRTDAASLEQYGKDWTKHHTPMPSAIVFPTTVEQVQSIVRFAKEHQLAIVPSGGRTGLSGGAVAYQGEIVVSFDYMNKILEFNALDQSVRVEAGVVTEVLQQFATEQGLFYPVDFASSGSSQIGGNIATNAGGIKVVRYGLTRDWVLGLTVVTGTGEILSLNQGLIKNATGYDFRHLLIGSEGTLGLIVEATIRLTKPPEHLTAMVLGVSDFDALMQVFHASRSQLTLTAFEFFSDKALNRVVARGDVPRPFAGDFPFYVLLEFEKDSEQKEADMLALFEHCVENGWVQEGVISQSETQYVQLWRLREDISETLIAEKDWNEALPFYYNDSLFYLTNYQEKFSPKSNFRYDNKPFVQITSKTAINEQLKALNTEVNDGPVCTNSYTVIFNRSVASNKDTPAHIALFEKSNETLTNKKATQISFCNDS